MIKRGKKKSLLQKQLHNFNSIHNNGCKFSVGHVATTLKKIMILKDPVLWNTECNGALLQRHLWIDKSLDYSLIPLPGSVALRYMSRWTPTPHQNRASKIPGVWAVEHASGQTADLFTDGNLILVQTPHLTKKIHQVTSESGILGYQGHSVITKPKFQNFCYGAGSC